MISDKVEYVKKHIGTNALLESFLDKHNFTKKDKQALGWAFEEFTKDKPNMMFIDDAYKVIMKNNTKIDKETQESSTLNKSNKFLKQPYRKYLSIGIFISISLYVLNSFGPILESETYMKHDNLVYKKNSDTPYTGTVEKYTENKNLLYKVSYVNGQLDGLGEFYGYDSSQKRSENLYQADKLLSHTAWNEEGEVIGDSKLEGDHIIITYYFKNGDINNKFSSLSNLLGRNDSSMFKSSKKKRLAGNILDLIPDGPMLNCEENGECIEYTYKYGLKNGKVTIFDKDGNIRGKTTLHEKSRFERTADILRTADKIAEEYR